MKKDRTEVFKKVVILGPDITGEGGISSVLSTYQNTMKGLRFRCTNSQKGTLSGLLVLSATLMQLIYDRISGRKIAHVHYASGKSWVRKKFLMRYARMLGYNVVAHCHSGAIDKYAKQTGIEKFHKELAKAKINIVLSQYWKNIFEKEFGIGNVEVVNNIVAKYENKATEHPSKKTTFVYLGAICDAKGVFEMLEALSKLKASGRELRLVVGGNGEVERFKAEVKRRGLEEIVDFRGWISGKEKDELLSSCDVLVLPSHAEGLPISVLEAMANGKAVISTPVGGIPDVVHDGENGFMVTPGDADGIAAAMERYISDPSLSRKHGRAGLEIVKPYYAPAVRDRLAELYERALQD